MTQTIKGMTQIVKNLKNWNEPDCQGMTQIVKNLKRNDPDG